MAEDKIAKVDSIDFHGTNILAAQNPEGIWVPINRVCEALGIDRKAQQDKLKCAEWATRGIIPLVGFDGKRRDIDCIHVDCLPMWLVTIEASKIREDKRETLVRFQREAAKALRDHFVRREAKSAAEIRLDRFLAEKASPHKVTFKERLTRELCRLYGHAFSGGRQPRFLASVYDKLYRTIYGVVVVDGLKERNPTPHFGSNHHQFFRDEARELLEDDLVTIYALADISRDSAEFWRRLEWHYQRRPLQLGW